MTWIAALPDWRIETTACWIVDSAWGDRLHLLKPKNTMNSRSSGTGTGVGCGTGIGAAGAAKAKRTPALAACFWNSSPSRCTFGVGSNWMSFTFVKR